MVFKRTRTNIKSNEGKSSKKRATFTYPTFVKSGNTWKAPSSDLTIDHEKFHDLSWFEKNDPRTAGIIREVLQEENKTVYPWIKYSQQIIEVSPTVLPATFLEIVLNVHPTETSEEKMERVTIHRNKTNKIKKEILEKGYQRDKPVWVVDKLFTNADPPQRFVVLDGGNHRLQAVRELIAENKIPKNFTIPVLVSRDA